ncbi:hypothetical protein COCOBI_06-5960 [Coccomyxa sp. Obi]|nr:hypothetical protein COCOBI_06-5960 [Coccomyxa sp. Obi]
MKFFAAFVLLLAVSVSAGASDDRDLTDAALLQLGLARSSLLQTVAAMSGRHLLVDYKGSDPIGADTVGNGKARSVVNLSVNPKLAAAPATYTAAAPVMAASTMATAAYAPTMSLAFTPAVTAYGASAPVSAPFGESAPSVEGRRLLVDYKGSDPIGSDTKGNGASLSGKSYANAVFKMAPAASPTAAPVSTGGPVPLSTILYSAVPTASKITLATAPTTAPGATAAPSLGGRRLLA